MDTRLGSRQYFIVVAASLAIISVAAPVPVYGGASADADYPPDRAVPAKASPTRRSSDFQEDLVKAALDRTKQRVRYDGRYIAISYPNGDVPEDIGVCTDVVIRSYRVIGTDLQVMVHEDMADNFGAYPSKRIWGLSGTDRNIDHRRVPNLRAFFRRHGTELEITANAEDYRPGDMVTWMLPGNLPHIGILTDRRSIETGNPMVVHNIGAGPELEDMLFDYEITGHYRYLPENYRTEGR